MNETDWFLPEDIPYIAGTAGIAYMTLWCPQHGDAAHRQTESGWRCVICGTLYRAETTAEITP